MENVTEVDLTTHEVQNALSPNEYIRAVEVMQTLYGHREAAKNAHESGTNAPNATTKYRKKKHKENGIKLKKTKEAYNKAMRSVVNKIRELARDYVKVYDESNESEAKMNFNRFLEILGDHPESMLEALEKAQKPNGVGLDWYFNNLVPLDEYFPLIKDAPAFQALKSNGEAKKGGRADLMAAIAWYYVLEEENLLPPGFKEMMVKKESNVNDKITMEMMLDVSTRTDKMIRMTNCRPLEAAREKFAGETGSTKRMITEDSLKRDADKSQKELALFMEVNCAIDWFILSLRIRTEISVKGAFTKRWHCFTDDQHRAAVQAGNILLKRRDFGANPGMRRLSRTQSALAGGDGDFRF